MNNLFPPVVNIRRSNFTSLKKLEFSSRLSIVKILYPLIFLFVCSLFLSSPEVLAASKCESLYSSLTQVKGFDKVLPANLVREKLYAVHATNFFPKNGVLIADGRDLMSSFF